MQQSDEALFVPFCVQQCSNQMAVLGLIDPNDCEGTVNTLSTLSPDFANACQNGI